MQRARARALWALVVAAAVWAVAANTVNLRRIHERAGAGGGGGRERRGAAGGGDGEDEPALRERWLQQPLDHMDAQNQLTLPQRFFVNVQWVGEHTTAAPLFVYLGGESALSQNRCTAGGVAELAQQFGAALACVEHRFYGRSAPPDAELNLWNLRYLTSSQALRDTARFIPHVRGVLELEYGVETSPQHVVVFGCSYAGALSAWFRTQHPHAARAALAGSAPVRAQLEFFEYDQVIAASAGPECARAVRVATRRVEDELERDAAAVKVLFGCASLAHDVDFLYVVADVVAYAIQYNHASNGLLGALCDGNEDVPGLVGSSDPLDAYAQYVRWAMNYTSTQANDWNIAGFTNTTISEDEMMRQWMYQSCVEFGYFQTAPSENSLRSSRVDLDYHLDVCLRLFGAPLRPAVDEINASRGGKHIGGSGILFTNGLADPWKELSILEATEFSGAVIAFGMEGEAHCANWRSSDKDSPAISEARRVTRSFITDTTGLHSVDDSQDASANYPGWAGLLLAILFLIGLGCCACGGVLAVKMANPSLPL